MMGIMSDKIKYKYQEINIKNKSKNMFISITNNVTKLHKCKIK